MALFKMEKPKKSEIPILLKPPLLEAIFELRWELLGDQQTGRFRDPAYPMMYGRMYERMKKDLPLIEDLPSVQMHPEAGPYVVRHRLRKEKTSWPLVQVGPGIATINDAKGYSWTRLRNLILNVVDSIVELYPSGGLPLKFLKAEIRYINGMPFDLQKEHPLGFLSEKLHTKIEVPQDLFSLNEMGEVPSALGLNLAYSLNRPAGNLAFSLNLGQVEDRNAYILQTLVQSLGEAVPQDKTHFDAWLEEAHQAAENAFASFCKGPLMQQFLKQ